MRHFVVDVIAEELVAPYRHVSRPVACQIRLAVDDAKDLQLGKFPAAALGNVGQIGYRDGEERRNRTRAAGICPVAGGAGHLIYTLPSCRPLARGLPRSARHTSAENSERESFTLHFTSSDVLRKVV